MPEVNVGGGCDSGESGVKSSSHCAIGDDNDDVIRI